MEKTVNVPVKGDQQECKRPPLAAWKAIFYTGKGGRTLHIRQTNANKTLTARALPLHTLLRDICRQTACFSE